ncbi:hypothetical protein BO94DRAFT_129988 [Aspergillus sclerotioniger CBS 115572]|uniref:Uncharacterized protein n=1 Tax=Aspergillus sclerotioniger CBS 115572 TaxID=1450535 RepID=A0A317XFL9_9EURO|nr:hypothetical protein BO94DRAFT_129988 [Aspergillus sclerotioniger CBS 115572]PWY95560.1 hypothetical protein BO94DRAFT_129988 [Aspergillus sclerotioniger CBS 115572]
MGQKLSAIHGVKSEDYDKPGNAINEVWLGNVEVISRLPFADSDMAQAAWPKGQFPKIPWHNFIIPWKRSASAVERAVESSAIAARQAFNDSKKDNMRDELYVYSVLLVVAILYCCAWSALKLPAHLAREEPPYRPDERPRSVVRNRFREKFSVCLISIIMGMVFWMMGLCVLNYLTESVVHASGPFTRSIVDITYTLPSLYFLGRGLRGLRFFWLAMKAIGEAGDDMDDEGQDGSVDAGLVEHQLPGNLASYKQRQRRA